MSALAAATERVEIGTLVLCSSFRDPSLVAKMAATADEVSGGRLILGLGAGWHDAEYDAFGFPKDHRVERFEEALRIIRPLLRGETVTFEGEYVTARDAVLEPPPSRDIPILVAAFGPRMLRLTARHADAWNTAWFGAPGRASARASGGARRGARGGGPGPRDARTHRRDRGARPVAPAGRAGRRRSGVRRLGRRARGGVGAYDELGIGHLIVVLQPMTEASLERLALALARR